MDEELQSAFAAALLRDAPIPPGVTSVRAQNPAHRFTVYRRNVLAALAGSLETRFPAAVAIVGAPFFQAMAAAFVRAHPPRSALLLAYGDGFPDFAASFEPAASLPYLADVMRIEVARARAYHARDCGAVTAAALEMVDPVAFGAMRASFHPAASMLRSRHPAATIWEMNSGGRDPAPIDPWEGEDVLVTRTSLQVMTSRLPPGAYAFLAGLAAGRTVADSATSATAEAPAFDFSFALAGLIAAGALHSLHQGDVP